MIKLVFNLHRLPHLSREEFQDYWLNTHGPLVRKHKDALGIKRYVQVHAYEDGPSAGARIREAPDAFDGVAELWFDPDGTSAATPEERAEAGRILLEDERKFIDLKRSPFWNGNEHEIIG